MLERIPLFDLNDVLLGHSCFARVPMQCFRSVPDGETLLGIDRHSRGIDTRWCPWDRVYEIWWFQPFGA